MQFCGIYIIMEIGVSFTKDSVKKLYENMGYKKTAENKKAKLKEII